MIVRALDENFDWTFGAGFNNYKSNRDAVAQNIRTRLLSFLGDCFFATNAGIDWFNFLGSKNQTALNLAISAMILNTENVTGIVQLSVTLTAQRNFTVIYNASTAFGNVTSTVTNPITSYLTTEDANILTDEQGNRIDV